MSSSSRPHSRSRRSRKSSASALSVDRRPRSLAPKPRDQVTDSSTNHESVQRQQEQLAMLRSQAAASTTTPSSGLPPPPNANPMQGWPEQSAMENTSNLHTPTHMSSESGTDADHAQPFTDEYIVGRMPQPSVLAGMRMPPHQCEKTWGAVSKLAVIVAELQRRVEELEKRKQ